MKIITALTGYTYDTHPFIILDINNVLYLFNLPPCCSRIFSDCNYSINKVRHIFLSSPSLEDSGGFLGSLIAILRPWKREVNITCPDSVRELLSNNDFFSKLKPEYLPHLSSETYSDDLITVTSIKTGQSNSYRIQCEGSPGRFLPDKAKKLGITPGPDFARLKAGETLINASGEEVKLSDCVGEPTKGETVLMIDIARDEDIATIPPAEALAEYDVIVHLTRMELVQKKSYLARFPLKSGIKHICFGFSGKISYKGAAQLYQDFVDHSDGMLDPLSTCEESCDVPESFINLSSGDSYIFSPSQKVSLIKDNSYVKIQKYSNFSCPLPLFQKFAITFLGTGAAIPVRCRGDPGILVHTKGGFVALDIGEGYVEQIYRKYGRENGKQILSEIRLIFLTHNHCDHSFGLHELLYERMLVTRERVMLFCDNRVMREVRFFESFYGEDSFGIIHVNSDDKNNREFSVNQSIYVKTVDVYHSSNSKGCQITIDGKWKMAYSGDRKALSDDHFVEEFAGVDFLIHEATFLSELDTEMDDYDHSTVNHAIDVQKQMNAKYMALVHFSQRYEKEYIPCPAENAFVTFDYLSFAFDDIENVCKMVKKVNRECLNHSQTK